MGHLATQKCIGFTFASCFGRGNMKSEKVIGLRKSTQTARVNETKRDASVYLHFGTYNGNILALLFPDNSDLYDSMEQMRNVYSDVNATNETVMKIEQRRFQSRVCPESPAGISGRNSHSWFNNSGSVFSGWVGGVVWCCGDGSQRVFGVSYYLQGRKHVGRDCLPPYFFLQMLDMVENQSTNALAAATSARDSPPMTLTYRLQSKSSAQHHVHRLILAPDWYWGESQTGYMSASFCIQMVVAASVFTWIQVHSKGVDAELVHSKGVDAELVHSKGVDAELVKPLQLTRLVHGRLVTKNLRHGLIHFLCDDTILSNNVFAKQVMSGYCVAELLLSNVMVNLAKSSKADGTGKRTGPSRAPIQIRETAGGGISLAGVTEAEVTSQEEI
ncbi:hypothetical protein LXL04_034921 [Taraxacum kok-saghyz]